MLGRNIPGDRYITECFIFLKAIREKDFAVLTVCNN